MKVWNVKVTGLGGPHQEFCEQTYQIERESAAQALSEAIEHSKRKWDEQIKRPLDVIDFYSAEIWPGQEIRILK